MAAPVPASVTLPVKGDAAAYAVRRIYCVGRNYADHVREMGGDPDREAPFFFAKPADAVVQNGTRHAWRNKGDTTCRMALFIVGAHHEKVGGPNGGQPV